MITYKNLSKISGVESYQLGTDHIIVRFKGNGMYRYDHKRPGKAHVMNMKKLAASGKGLSTYISRYVKENYAEKLEYYLMENDIYTYEYGFYYPPASRKLGSMITGMIGAYQFQNF